MKTRYVNIKISKPEGPIVKVSMLLNPLPLRPEFETFMHTELSRLVKSCKNKELLCLRKVDFFSGMEV